VAKTDIVECVSCGGRYRPIQDDGTEYYHVCPPNRVIDDGPVDPAQPDGPHNSHVEPIANPRNENVVGLDEQNQPIIVSAGAGITAVLDQAAIDAFNAKGVKA
jgi:hypothetical protein